MLNVTICSVKNVLHLFIQAVFHKSGCRFYCITKKDRDYDVQGHKERAPGVYAAQG